MPPVSLAQAAVELGIPVYMITQFEPELHRVIVTRYRHRIHQRSLDAVARLKNEISRIIAEDMNRGVLSKRSSFSARMLGHRDRSVYAFFVQQRNEARELLSNQGVLPLA
jgi:hypothetical protein